MTGGCAGDGEETRRGEKGGERIGLPIRACRLVFFFVRLRPRVADARFTSLRAFVAIDFVSFTLVFSVASAFRSRSQKAAALLGNMMIQGYGCKADPERGRVWVEKARRKGYRMQGVYCEI